MCGKFGEMGWRVGHEILTLSEIGRVEAVDQPFDERFRVTEEWSWDDPQEQNWVGKSEYVCGWDLVKVSIP
jgi:hypothetical protein